MRTILIHISVAIMRFPWIARSLVACLVLWGIGSLHAEETTVQLTIRGHKFEPAEIVVPAGQKVKLVIENQDSTPEEFESYELNREKVVPAKGSVIIFVGPLKPGRYPFFGDFNRDSAKGVLVAK
jgi:plastocyanin